MIKQTQIDELVSRIVKHLQPYKIILFGSYATGNADNCSDLDLLILGEKDKPMTLRTQEILRLT